LQAACRTLSMEGMGDFPVISIAKRFEWIYVPDSSNPLRLAQDSPALRLIQRVRDEAHRFAVGYHRRLKERSLTASSLDEIPGIGAARKKVLFRHFESIEEMSRTTPEQLAGLPGMDKDSAIKVLSWLSSKKASNL